MALNEWREWRRHLPSRGPPARPAPLLLRFVGTKSGSPPARARSRLAGASQHALEARPEAESSDGKTPGGTQGGANL